MKSSPSSYRCNEMTETANLYETFIAGLVSGDEPQYPALIAAQTGPKIQTPGERREAWLRQRLGKFTASEFHRLMANGKNGELSVGLKTYATEKAVELLTDPVFDHYTSPAMQWGLDHEAEAIAAFMTHTGFAVESHSHNQQFLTLGDAIGGTPDGYIKGPDPSGIEVKCPASKTHLEYFRIVGASTLYEIAPQYYWQCQGLMLITGYKFWNFVSYDPRFKDPRLRLHCAIIQSQQTDLELLASRLGKAIDYRNVILSALAD